MMQKLFSENNQKTTGQKSTGVMRLNASKIVSRPTIVVKKYKAVRTACAQEYNELKREMNYLCREFVAPGSHIHRERKLTYRIGKLALMKKNLLKAMRIQRMVNPCISYSKVAEKGAKVTLAHIEVKQKPLLSRYQARRDYQRAYETMKQEQRNALLIVQGMANRRPRKIYPKEKKEVDLVNQQSLREQLRALAREKRYLARHPAREVKMFDLRGEIVIPPVEVDFPEVFVCKGKVIATSVKNVKRRFDRYKTYQLDVENQREVKRKNTSSRLTTELVKFLKFSAWLRSLRQRRMDEFEYFLNKYLYKTCYPVGQMDNDGVVQSDIQTAHQASNVIITSESKDEKGEPPLVNGSFHQLSVSKEQQSFDTLANRWFAIDNIEWNTSMTRNQTIYQEQFPYHIIKGAPNIQMSQLMLINRFYRCDLKFKVVLNSSPWQIGMLVMDWMYGNKQDTRDWDNVYTALQRNHIKLSAGSANNAILEVPYQHYNSYLSNISSQGYFGSLSIRVLNSLSVTDSVATKATLTLFVAMPNLEAHGLLDRSLGTMHLDDDIVQGQMNSIGDLCNVGSNLLRTAGKVFNRDKPPLPLQPLSLIPQTMPSFCYTDGISEPINVLRSDPRGQRVSPFSTEEMRLVTFSRTWGYVRTLEWRFSDTAQSKLDRGTFECKPMYISDDYMSVVSSKLPSFVKAVVYPPVAVLSSFTSKVRGNIEFRFEVVANKFYTGSLQISIIPLLGPEWVTAPLCLGSATYVLDLQQTTVMDVSAPWNWFNPYMRTINPHTGLGNSYAKLCVYVVNPLVAVATVPSTVYINVYMRGGDNFEAIQLRTPILGLANQVLQPPEREYLTPWNFETKWYVSDADGLRGDKSSLCTIFIQNISNGWVGYTGMEELTVYQLSRYTNWNREFRVQYQYRGRPARQDIRYGIYHPALATSNAHGLVVLPDKNTAIRVLRMFMKGYTDIDGVVREAQCGYAGADGDWSQIRINGIWTQADNASGEHPVWFRTTIDENTPFDVTPVTPPRPEKEEDYVVVGQMDSNGVLVVEELAPTTQMGVRIYGEEMPDLKGIARRWQHFGSVQGRTSIHPQPRDSPYLFKFEVCPQRQVVPKVSNDYDNRIREGTIGLLNGCFAFWEGGMRYRIVISHAVPENTVLFVQHRFDEETTLRRTDEEAHQRIFPGPKEVRTYLDLMDTHYPTCIQSLDVNPTITIEVPYMRSEERLVTTSRYNRPYHNGFVYVWAHSPVAEDLFCELYYSVADDFQWSVFQGMPPMLEILDIPKEPQPSKDKVVGQMDERPTLAPYFQRRRISVSSVDEESDFEYCTNKENPKGDGLLSFLTGCQIPADDRINTTLNKFDEATVKLAESGEKVADNFAALSTKIQTFVDTVSDIPSNLSQAQKTRIEQGHLSSFFSDMKNASFDYLTHLVYCAMNPKGETIAWAIINIYRNIWGFTFDGISTLTSSISSLWKRATQSTQRPQTETPIGQNENSDITSLCSVLYCSLCTLLKLSIKPPTSWRNIAEGLFDFSSTCKSSSFLSQFVKDNIELFRRVWNKLLSYFSVNKKNYKLIAGIEDQRLKQWCVHAAAILNPAIKENIYTNPIWAEKVFELSVAGRGLALSLAQDKTVPVGIVNIINVTLKQLKKLEEDLINRKVFCGERYEPMCLWIAGKAGTCKTRFGQSLAADLAMQVGKPTPHPYHTITFQQQYFDGFMGQPCVLIDDFLTTSPVTDPTAHMYIQMKSSALFNPPYSDVKDKSRLVNFQNLIVTSNFLKVANMPGIHDETAYNRRRDILIEFVIRKDAKPKENMTVEDYESMNHIDAFHYNDAIKCDTKVYIPHVDGLPYSQAIKNYILGISKQYHMKESQSFSNRCQIKIRMMEEMMTTSECLEEYLEKCNNSFLICQTDGSTTSLGKTDFFKYWMSPQKEEVVASDIVEGQMDMVAILEDRYKSYWPYAFDNKLMESTVFSNTRQMTTLDEVGEGEVVEPFKRSALGWVERKNKHRCLHRDIVNFDDYSYDPEIRAYCHSISLQTDHENMVTSFPVGYCMIKSGNEMVVHPECLLATSGGEMKMVSYVLESILTTQKHCLATFPDLDEIQTAGLLTLYPEYHLLEAIKLYKQNDLKHDLQRENIALMRRIENMQKNIAQEYVEVDGQPIPRRSRIKTICQSVWKGFLTVCKWISKAFKALISVCSVLTLIGSLGMMGASLYTYSQVNERGALPEVFNNWGRAQGHLHASGDYKTMRAARGPRNQAATLIRPNNNDASFISSVTDQDLLTLCKEQFVDPSSDGRLRKICSNVFTLVGMAHLSDGHYITYKVRCIGLRHYDFLVLKHYIEHFKSRGVSEVAIVYHKGNGIQRFRLSDINFVWTEGGYGVGTFPSLARGFKNITKFIPSENFDGNYPYEMYMVTVNMDDVQIQTLACHPLRRPQYIPQNGEQSAWTIKQGFTYDWGGSGRCGSFLFAPRMASPLVAVHTAGIREHTGFAELLLRETFDDGETPYVDFVEPQMDYKEDGYIPPGECLILGHVNKDKAVALPTKTKIEPSIVAPVFPIRTEPAPLHVSDSRLPPGVDPLTEGILKRCQPPKEFPEGLLNMAFDDYAKCVLAKVQPLRSPGVLSIKEAIEGLTLEGYEPLEITTSEGYPWTLSRPPGASNKSYLFQFENYADGRRKLVGIDRKLSDTLKMKEQFRDEFIVPMSYYTACLKDARIPKEKASIPGKTRVFEMSPVDLTIPQRQYFLDFYAGFCKTRLNIEHTIGINPDGPEWTELAERLLNFSPHILTADYSGYGPRLLHTVQRRAYMVILQWYEQYLERNGTSEEDMQKQFRQRYTLMWELLHPPHIVRDCIVYFNTGMQSGNAATVIMNTNGNSLYIRVMYLYLANKYAKHYADMSWFHKFVLMFSNGDDLIMAVKDEIIEWFNNRTLIEGFADFDIKMTDAMKSGVVREYCTLEEATYLKRGFKRHPMRDGQWLAPLELASVTDTANWIWKCIDSKTASYTNSEMCARLAYTRGPDEYQRIVKRLEQVWLQHKVVFDAPSWESLDMHIWEGTEGPRFGFKTFL